MVENNVMKKTCEICNSEYSNNSKYCPICGGKNEEYSYSNEINEIKEEIKKSEYYKLRSLEEISKLGINIPEKKVCSNCGCKNPESAQFCEDCGADLRNSKEKIRTSAITVCANCGAVTPEGVEYCPDCGGKEKIETNVINICPRCGAIAHDGDKFCPECGENLMI